MEHNGISEEDRQIIALAHLLLKDHFSCTADEVREGFNSFLSEITAFATLSALSTCAQQTTPCFEGHFQEYDTDRLGLVARYLPKDPVIFEAGGHHGTDTVCFAQKWPLATIISFEANPSSFKKFLINTVDFKNITGHNLAIADANGTATLHICDLGDSASSLLAPSKADQPKFAGPLITVPCTILDDWCRANHIDYIDFMWLDLEGMELQILQSSPEILNTVKVIYTETNFREYRIGTTQYDQLKAFLEKSGFMLLAHWYLKGYQGDAIFIRKELF